MASVLATLAALAAIGLLVALDPGGAIAESGFPDYQDMGWKQLTAWGFRTIGVGVALLLVLALLSNLGSNTDPGGESGIETHLSRQPGSAPGCRRRLYRCWKTGRSATERCWRR